MTTLTELAAMLDAATGPSRELDAEIWEALGLGHLLVDGGEVLYVEKPASSIRQTRHSIPEVTSSIDAAEALRQRVLPRTFHRAQVLSDCCTSQIAIPNEWLPTETAPTECLARLKATVAALIAKEMNDEP